jgi:hypothetical protein
MRIDRNGDLMLGKTSVLGSARATIEVSGQAPLSLNRTTDDGNLVQLYQAGTQEGAISVSGTTVTYGGGHLGRWAQWDGAPPADLLRGTVVSNRDAMCVWKELSFTYLEPDLGPRPGRERYYGEAGVGSIIALEYNGQLVDATVELSANDQLNKICISDVVGDRNVAGVLDFIDSDGEPVVAQTGDYLVRINAGVVVQRGDLLESSGNGCAKPQSDDIIRSKTVAKVNSTQVARIYPDGSYLVPCTLMAGG